jgi:uncharacterized membrane protein
LACICYERGRIDISLFLYIFAVQFYGTAMVAAGHTLVGATFGVFAFAFASLAYDTHDLAFTWLEHFPLAVLGRVG